MVVEQEAVPMEAPKSLRLRKIAKYLSKTIMWKVLGHTSRTKDGLKKWKSYVGPFSPTNCSLGN